MGALVIAVAGKVIKDVALVVMEVWAADEVAQRDVQWR